MAIKRKTPVPNELVDAYLLDATNWPPDVLDACDRDRLELFLLFKQVKEVAIYGGELDFGVEKEGELEVEI